MQRGIFRVHLILIFKVPDTTCHQGSGERWPGGHLTLKQRSQGPPGKACISSPTSTRREVVGKYTFLTMNTTSLNETITQVHRLGELLGGRFVWTPWPDSDAPGGNISLFSAQRHSPHHKALCHMPGPPPGQGCSDPDNFPNIFLNLPY